MRKKVWFFVVLCSLYPNSVLSMEYKYKKEPPENQLLYVLQMRIYAKKINQCKNENLLDEEIKKLEQKYCYYLNLYRLSNVSPELQFPALLKRFEQSQKKSTENSDSAHQALFTYQTANGYHTAKCSEKNCTKTFLIKTINENPKTNKNVLRRSIGCHLATHNLDPNTLIKLISSLDNELGFGKKTTQKTLMKLEEGTKRLQSIDPTDVTTEQAKQFLSLSQSDEGGYFIECPLCSKKISAKRFRLAWNNHLSRTQSHLDVNGLDLGFKHKEELLFFFDAMELPSGVNDGVNKRKKG